MGSIITLKPVSRGLFWLPRRECRCEWSDHNTGLVRAPKTPSLGNRSSYSRINFRFGKLMVETGPKTAWIIARLSLIHLRHLVTRLMRDHWLYWKCQYTCVGRGTQGNGALFMFRCFCGRPIECREIDWWLGTVHP